MPDLTPKQKRKLEKIAKIIEDGDLSIAEFLFEIEEKFEETVEEIKKTLPDLDKILQTIKGKDAEPPTKEEVIEWLTPFIPKPEKGDKGDDGKDYILTDKDKKEIAGSIKVPVVEKIIEKTEVIRETPIVTENVVEKAMYESGEQIVEKINDLPIEPGFQIGKEHIVGLDEIERLARQPKGRAVGWASGIKEIRAGTGISIDNSDLRSPIISTSGAIITSESPTGTVNGVNRIFTVLNVPIFVISDGMFRVSGFGYSYSSGTITMDETIPPTEYIRSFYNA